MFKIAFSPLYIHPLPENHKFPMAKYELLPQQLLREGIVREENFFTPHPMEEADILRVHHAQYWDDLKHLRIDARAQRKTGFVHSEQLIERERVIMQGTLDCTLFALEHGMAMNIAGGTHHAYTDRGEGFCLLNDIALSAQYLLDTGKASRILVVDLDVHQGNGTAQIFEHEPRVFTFSMHGRSNYPISKEKSDLDVALEKDTGDLEYLKLLNDHLDHLFAQVKPDVVFFQSGVDVLKTDKLGTLSLSLQGCAQRDEAVLRRCHEQQIPVVASMGGGYSPDIRDIIDAHTNTYRIAHELYF